MTKVYVIVPAYNEGERLNTNAFKVFAEKNDICFLFVNDGSTDATGALLLKLANTSPKHISVLTLQQNSGKAEAIRQGMVHVLGKKIQYVGYWDADLATPLEAIMEFLEVLQKKPSIEVVTGARVALLGRSIHRRLFRHYTGRVFATIASIWLHLPMYDTQCGAKLFRATPMLSSITKKPFVTNWIFDVELLARMQRHSLNKPLANLIYEFPLQKWDDISGSKIKIGDFLNLPIELLRLVFFYRKRP